MQRDEVSILLRGIDSQILVLGLNNLDIITVLECSELLESLLFLKFPCGQIAENLQEFAPEGVDSYVVQPFNFRTVRLFSRPGGTAR